jgi:hypothetical protein
VQTDGTVACWGRNDTGQASPPGGTFTQVSAGAAHSCGVRTDGTLACWGANDTGQASPPTGTFTQVSSFRGTAERVGSGLATGKVSISGKLHSLALSDLRLTTLIVHQLLFEGASATELVRRSGSVRLFPVTLAPRRGSRATAALYETATGVVPKVQVELKQRDPKNGVVEFKVTVERVVIAAAPACGGQGGGSTTLQTRLDVNSSAGNSVVLATAQPWVCAGDKLQTP